MKAQPLINEKRDHLNGQVVIRVWKLPAPIKGLNHSYKYSLVYVVSGKAIVLYDVHPGKTDHKHINGVESIYTFTTIRQLLADFYTDVEAHA